MGAVENIEEAPAADLPPEILFGKNKRAKNWADDATVRDRIKSEIHPMLTMIRSRRGPLNALWASMLKVMTLESESPGYEGRSNIYVPAGKKAAETIVSQLVSGTFPGDDNFGIDPRREEDAEAALNVKDVLSHQIDNVVKLRVHAERFYRQLVTTGNSPVKIYYRRKTIRGYGRKGMNEALGNKDFVTYDGPVWESIDINNLYYWPDNASDPVDTDIVFEDMSISRSEVLRLARNGNYSKDVVEGMKGGAEGEQIGERQLADTRKMQGQGLTPVSSSGPTHGWGMVDISEVYLMFDPKAATKDEETDPVPFLITLTASGEVLKAIRNPWWHQRPPYLLGRMGTVVGRLYGTGYVETIRDLQLLLNDQTNQTMDCATFALNPMLLVNPNMVLGSLPDMEPGVQFLVQDVNNAVKAMTLPMEPLNVGLNLQQSTISMIQDMMGAPPVLQGGASPGRAFKTATGIDRAQKNATVPLQEVIRLCEKEVWEETLRMFHSLDEQFATDDYLMYFSGGKALGKPKRISPSELAGDMCFKWVASTQTDNKTVKGGQITQLLQLLSTPGIAQQLQANGYMFNPAPLLKRLFIEVFGFRDFDDVLKVMMQQPGMTPGSAGGMPPPGAQPPGTAVPGPGEAGGNEDLAGTRMGANENAAFAGGANNAPTA